MIEGNKKYEIFRALAQGFNSYTATQWLKTPHSKLKGETPASLLSAGESHDRLLEVLASDLKSKSPKRKE